MPTPTTCWKNDGLPPLLAASSADELRELATGLENAILRIDRRIRAFKDMLDADARLPPDQPRSARSGTADRLHLLEQRKALLAVIAGAVRRAEPAAPQPPGGGWPTRSCGSGPGRWLQRSGVADGTTCGPAECRAASCGLPGAGSARTRSLLREIRMRPLLVPLVLAAAAASAAEGHPADVRLVAGIGHVDVEGDGNVRQLGSSITGNGLSGDDDERVHLGIQAMCAPNGLQGRMGLLTGIEMSWSEGSSALHADAITSDITLDTRRYGVDLLAGVGAAAGPRWHLELTPFVGLARIERDITAHTAGGDFADEDAGTAWRYGARGAAWFTSGARWQMGIEARWFVERSSSEFDQFVPSTPPTQLDAAIEERGLLMLVGVGYRL